jgi:hypothetical protein
MPGPWVLPGSFCVSPVVGISPGIVVEVVAGGNKLDTTPHVGISPASAETERTQVMATVNMNRFMGLLLHLRKVM